MGKGETVTYQEKPNSKISHSSISFKTIEELIKEVETIKNSNIKKVSLCKSDIGENSWGAVRNILLDYFAYTDTDIIIYV